jgi:hypothetical protein
MGSYGSVSGKGVSNGLVQIVFAPEGRDDSPLRPEEINMVQWIIDYEKSIHDSTMGRMLVEYPSFRNEVFEDYNEEDAAEMAPLVTTVDELKRLCGIVSINIHPLVKSGMPFIGVEFGCNWDEEHGVGVLLHGSTPLECGDADTAIYLWIAEKHANKS